MASLITSHARSLKLQNPFPHLNYLLTRRPILLHTIDQRRKIHLQSFTFRGSFGLRELKRGRKCSSSCCCWGKQSEGDVELEAEIMNFMEKSERPTMFPTKRELVKAGRMDLVEAIQERGGWYSLGWDDENAGDKDNVEGAMDYDIWEFQRRVESCKESASLRENCGNTVFDHGEGEDFSYTGGSDSRNSNSVQLASSGSLELGVNGDAGIEGILSRLEKQRNNDFGINLGKMLSTRKHGKYDVHIDTSEDVVMSGFLQKDILNTSDGKTTPTIEPKNWRTWSHQRAGFQYTEFEAAEISFCKSLVESENKTYYDGKTVTNDESAEAWDRTNEIDHNQIRSRLQHLESELATALSSLRSKRGQSISEETIGSSTELHKLSDAWEFQENEFISSQERLRSIRAKLAVLEGKMTLAIIEAQKVVEEKQKRIDGARKALQLLRSTCIVWPNSASEVLLAGSFDGWTTQRKMEKSRSGVFSVYLKLYPGRYEMKFIVDGIWKVDPLRPIVNNNGYDNNLLIVT